MERGDCMNKDYIVTQANELIMAKQTKPLSLREKRLIVTLVSMIEPQDEAFKEYNIRLREFYKLLGLNEDVHYSQLKQVVDDLMSKVIEIPLGEGGWLKTHWVSRATYIEGEGMIKLSFDPHLREYLLMLKKAFTSYKLNNVLSLQSTYGLRLYEILKSWEYVKSEKARTVELIRLREMLGVDSKTYPKYSNFKIKVLNKAIEEINSKTDLNVNFKEIKESRRVIALEFSINGIRDIKKLKGPEEAEDVLTKDGSLREKVANWTIGYSLNDEQFKLVKKSVEYLYPDYPEELVFETLIKYVNAKAKGNPTGFLFVILKNKEEIYNQGVKLTLDDFDLQNKYSRSEVIPDWMNKEENKVSEQQISVTTEELNVEEMRQQLLEEIGKK